MKRNLERHLADLESGAMHYRFMCAGRPDLDAELLQMQDRAAKELTASADAALDYLTSEWPEPSEVVARMEAGGLKDAYDGEEWGVFAAALESHLRGALDLMRAENADSMEQGAEKVLEHFKTDAEELLYRNGIDPNDGERW